MAKVNAFDQCPIFAEPLGALLNKELHIGIFGDDTGVSMLDPADSNTRPLLGLFPNLKSTDSALSAGSVVAGIHSRFLVNKAQTNDCSVFGAELQCRVKANLGTGVHAGAWLYWEQSGTVTCTGYECAASIAVEAAATLTATYLSGALINSAVNASATVTNFAAIWVKTTTSAKPFDYIIDVSTGGAPAVGAFRFTAVTNVIADSGDTPGTPGNGGYVKVLVGTSVRYIKLYLDSS